MTDWQIKDYKRGFIRKKNERIFNNHVDWHNRELDFIYEKMKLQLLIASESFILLRSVFSISLIVT